MATIGVPVVSIDSQSKIIFHEDTLRRIVSNEKIKDLPVCVFSIAGPPGNGKSFILDFFLRYIHLRYRRENDLSQHTQLDTKLSLPNWINYEDQPLESSKWTNEVTNGILIWPEVLVCRAMDRRRVAVVFLEVHGSFDEGEDSWKWMNMFILSTLMSSTQIVNISSELKAEHLEILNVFFGYGQQMKTLTGKQPLQKFYFLVRDWKDTKKADLGSWGGYSILRNLVMSQKLLFNDLTLMKRIQNTFLEVGCYLMPNPGVDRLNETEPIVLKKLNTQFLDHMNELVRLFIGPGNINSKDVCGTRWLTRDLPIYFGTYISEALNSSEIPQTSNIYSATSKASHDVAKDEAVRLYALQMLWLCSGRWGLNTSQLFIEHKQSRELAMTHFLTKPKLGGHPFTSLYKSEVDAEFEALFDECARKNRMARVKHYLVTMTTVTLLIVILVFCIISVLMFTTGRPDLTKYTFTVTDS